MARRLAVVIKPEQNMSQTATLLMAVKQHHAVLIVTGIIPLSKEHTRHGNMTNHYIEEKIKHRF